MKTRKYHELNEHKREIYKNVWDTAKVVLRGKCLGLNAVVEKRRSQINDSVFQKRNLKQKKSKVNLKQ